MSRARVVTAVTLSFLGASLLLYAAVREDATGTAENLAADVLTIAVVTVAVRELVVSVERRRFLASYSPLYAEVLSALARQEEHYEELVRWASQRSTDSTSGGWPDLDFVLEGSKFGVAPDMSSLDRGLRSMAADYGAIDLSPIVARFQQHSADASRAFGLAWDGVRALRRWQDPFEVRGDDVEIRSQQQERVATTDQAMAGVARSAQSSLQDLEYLRAGLTEPYEPRVTGARFHPEPFARWLLALTICLGAICLGALVMCYLSPRSFPDHFARATVDNVLAASVAASIGAGLAAGSRFTASRRVLIRAARPGARLLASLTWINGALGMKPEDERAQVLKTVAHEVRDCVNQLQHVVPDARLDRYADDFLIEVEAALGRPSAQDYLDVSPENMAALGLSGLRPPSPPTIRLVMASAHLGSRVSDLYFKRRSL